MGSNMPTTIPELVNWCAVHADLWRDNFAAIGLTTQQAAIFGELNDALAAANASAEAARQASKDATANLQLNIDAIRGLGNAYIGFIDSFAETTDNPKVYTLAGITPRAQPSQLPPPNTPTTFSAGVNPDGSLAIKWKVSQPAGTSGVQYLVSRRINGAGQYTLLSSEGRNKSFTDTGLPVGVDRVEYIVQPKRGTVTGPQSNVFAVQFGSVPIGMGGGGSLSIVSTNTEPQKNSVKLAA